MFPQQQVLAFRGIAIGVLSGNVHESANKKQAYMHTS